MYLEKLDRFDADPEAVIRRERADSYRYGGRTVGGPVSPGARRREKREDNPGGQLSLF